MSWPPGPAILFCPADRPERFEKAADRADGVILDLEDGMGPERSDEARAAIARSSLDPERTAVRLSASAGVAFERDCIAVAEAGYRYAVLPKCETADFGRHDGLAFVPQIETARALRELDGIAARDDVIALLWGVEDLVRSLGGTAARDESGAYTDVIRHVRALILLTASMHAKPAVDAVFGDFRDTALQESDARAAARMGFAATACIHPAQVDAIRAGYRPTPEQFAWAEEVVDRAVGGGAFALDGAMIDAPVVAQAERILSRRRGAGHGG